MRQLIRQTHPDVARDFHPTRNKNLRIDEIAAYDRTPVWWRCSSGHDYQVTVYTRVRVGCRECNRIKDRETRKRSKQLAAKRGSIRERQPKLLKRWDFDKNEALGIDPGQITPGSHTEVHWRCEQGHLYQRSPKRELKAVHCPVCYNENITAILSSQMRKARTNPRRTLAHVHPQVAAEWDFDKNELSPQDYAPQSNAKVWWRCGFGHSWPATITNRTGRGSGCPYCRITASRMEVFIFAELKHLFPKTKLKATICGQEADVFVPELSLAIEIDGYYWHKDKIEFDVRKDEHFKTNGIDCFRLRQDGLPFISSRCVGWKGVNLLEEAKTLFLRVGKELRTPDLINYTSRLEPLNPGLYNEVVARLPAPEYEDSLAALEPKISAEWDEEVNGFLQPHMFTPGSDQKVFWKCSVCGNAWEATIKNRTLRGSGCPKCAIERSRTPRQTCSVCGQEFKPKGKQKHCSPTCAGIAKTIPKRQANCAFCGKSFQFRESEGERVYCSIECYHSARKTISKPTELVGKTREFSCIECGRKFLGESWRDRKFCSPACFRKSSYVAEEVICAHCGETFVNRTSQKRRFCSQECHYAHR